MARTETVSRTLFTFAELSDDAKEVARDWYRGCIESEELADHDDWGMIADIIGVSFGQQQVRLMGGGTRYDPRIYWSLHPTECAFDGTYAYAKGAGKRIRQHAPIDVELHRIADELQLAQRHAFYGITADCREERMCQRVSADCERYLPAECERVEELLADFARWIGRQIEGQYDYLTSDEAVTESIEANAYEFDENGRIA